MKKYELTTIQGKDVILDISQLFNQEILYVNATRIAKQFGKRIDNYMRLDDTKSYIDILNTSDVRDLELIKINRGRYGGTYIHSSLLVHFLRWIDTEFAVKCDLYIKSKLQKVHDEKSKAIGRAEANKENAYWGMARDHGKDTRKLLTDKIKEFCLYAENQRGTSYNSVCPYYKLITKVIYSFIGIDIPKLGIAHRDVYSGDIIETIEAAECCVIKLLDEIMYSEGSRKGIKPLIIDRLTHEMGNLV